MNTNQLVELRFSERKKKQKKTYRFTQNKSTTKTMQNIIKTNST